MLGELQRLGTGDVLLRQALSTLLCPGHEGPVVACKPSQEIPTSDDRSSDECNAGGGQSGPWSIPAGVEWWKMLGRPRALRADRASKRIYLPTVRVVRPGTARSLPTVSGRIERHFAALAEEVAERLPGLGFESGYGPLPGD